MKMKVKCVKLVEGKFGQKPNALEWNDSVYPIRGAVYTVTNTRIDCENDKGYTIEGMNGWWSASLFTEIECCCNKK